MKALLIILKVIETIMTCIWGVAVGIFFPLGIMTFAADMVPADIAARTDLMIIWLVTAVIGFLIPAALIFCKRYKTAAVMSVLGLIGVLILRGGFVELYQYTAESNGPEELYMPLIFVTLLDIIIMAIAERDKIALLFENRKAEQNKKAPSILDDDRKD